MARVFITGGGGLIGSALVSRLVARGDEVIALARSDAAANTLDARGARVIRGDALDEDAVTRGMAGCALAFNVAGINSLCVEDEGPMRAMNAEAPVIARAIGEARGRRPPRPHLICGNDRRAAGDVGSERTPHRGWYLSTYERTKTEGERAALAASRELEQDLVCVNPSSVQGPGRSGGTGRFLLAFLDGRLKVFVATNVSLVDIQDCVEGHLLASERGAAGERYLLSGIGLTISEALALAAEVAGVDRKPRLLPRSLATAAAAVVERSFRLVGRHPPVCREMVRTLLHGHRYDGSRAERELGLTYTDPRDTLRRTVEWARSEGLMP